MRTRTLLQLRTAAMQRADMENSEHLSAVEWNENINESIAALHAILVETCEDDFTSYVDFATVAGQSEYAIAVLVSAGNYYKIRGVHILRDGVYRELDRWSLNEWSRLKNTYLLGGSWWGWPGFYNIVGAYLDLQPAPQGVYTARLFYVAASVDLTDDTKFLDGRDGWEEWVTLDAAIKGRIKEETDTSDLVSEREKVEQRLRTQSQRLNQAHPPSVHVTGDGPWRGGEW